MQRTTNPSDAGSGDWLHLAARAGEQGRAWADVYRRYSGLAQASNEALDALRKRRLAAGVDRLERLRDELDSLRSAPRSVRHVLDRFYYGVLGYLFYCRGDLDRADRAMRQASRAVIAAICRQPCLMPLANHCHEFCLHRARIARNGRRWEQMEELVSEARAMMENRRPLCVLADGREIFYATLAEFVASLDSLADDSNAEGEGESVDALVDDALRLRLFERFVRRLYALPGFAIIYP